MLRRLLCLSPWIFLGGVSARAAEPQVYKVGVAKINVTPSYPIRLHGFGFRRTESEGVTQKIWAKALAIDDGEPAVLIAVDNLGVPAAMVQDLARRLQKKTGLKPERLAVTASHTHTAPMLRGIAPTIFGMDIPREHQVHIDRYTREFADNLEKVALGALADRKPARLSWGIGKATFGKNRRTKGGPKNHDLPILVVRDLQNKLRAIYINYACHCVTLSNNKISGDWAGFAQEEIEGAFPGTVALASVGCGGDQNPTSGVTGDKVEIARAQGREIALEVKRLLGGFLAPISGKITAIVAGFELPLAPLPSREQWEERAQKKGAVGYHARVQLDRLKRGQALRTRIDYSVQTWAFGDSLAMVFLPGEVVVDYSLRLKKELDGLRLWINAYANDDPCYIPSERVLKEGGYEGGGAMIYYDVPGPLAPGLEKKIVEEVHRQIGKDFALPFDLKGTSGSLPLPPPQSLACIRTSGNLVVELMAAEPLVIDPVAIDWRPDGKLWVAEMYDYPSGTTGDFQPGGRVKLLEDTDGDGIYDRATVFLDKIPFPTGVTAWKKGVLVCAAPDILYAEDTDGDGKADVVKKLFTGFGTHNYQARVNSLQWGLDNWVHGSCGLFGGTIKNWKSQAVALGDRDFRIKPDEGILEPASGRTQQGRPGDDWGSWFGCNNSTLCLHYPLPDHYLRRNPRSAAPVTAVLVPRGPNANMLFPGRRDLQLFKLSGPAGRTTAACGLGFYRDDLLGNQYAGNAFVCEPVNLVVHRLILSAQGFTFAGKRAPEEKDREFLASTDNWFRPVQVRTGPDGCLWVVDMYRYVIEHPRWIPPADLKKLDVRAGDKLGRIYRIRPKDRQPRPIVDLTRLDGPGLVQALDSPNGPQQDLATQMLIWKKEVGAAPLLEKLVRENPRPQTRVHALCVLDALGKIDGDLLAAAIKDEHPGVRRQAVRLAEKFPGLAGALAAMVLPRGKAGGGEKDPQVLLQLAFSLGAMPGNPPAFALAQLAMEYSGDPIMQAAVLSSLNEKNLTGVMVWVYGFQKQPPEKLSRALLRLAVTWKDKQALKPILSRITTPEGREFAPWQWAALEGILVGLEREGLEALEGPTRIAIRHMLDKARKIAESPREDEKKRLAAIPLLGRDPGRQDADLNVLEQILIPQNSPALQAGALTALGRINADRVPALLMSRWKSQAPALKGTALDVLLSRPAWQVKLLEGIEKNQVPAGQVDLPRRNRLLNHKDPAIRTRAARVFSAAGSDRLKVIQDYRKAAKLKGDPGRGKMVFAKSCAACHQVEGAGHNVGPDLAAQANRSFDFLLVEILDPSRNVDSRYVEYVATTKNGRVFTGMLATETATSIALRGPEGKEQILLRQDLDELHSTGKSLMPEGLEKDVSPQAMADLIAYLGRVPVTEVKKR